MTFNLTSERGTNWNSGHEGMHRGWEEHSVRGSTVILRLQRKPSTQENSSDFDGCGETVQCDDKGWA